MLRSNRLSRLALPILLGLLCATGALAAATGGVIKGTVTDPSGKVIANATIDLTDVNTGQVYHVHSDTSGHYTLPVVPVGTYSLAIAAPGFGTYQRNSIAINDNSALTFDVDLAVGAVTASVNVSDNSLHIETNNSQMEIGRASCRERV